MSAPTDHLNSNSDGLAVDAARTLVPITSVEDLIALLAEGHGRSDNPAGDGDPVDLLGHALRMRPRACDPSSRR